MTAGDDVQLVVFRIAGQHLALNIFQVERILRGEQTEGFEAPRLVGPGAHRNELDEMRHLEILFDLLPLLPARAIDWLIESRTYRLLPRGMAVRQLLALMLAVVGDGATRERIFTILGSARRASIDQARWRLSNLGTNVRKREALGS